MGPQRQGDVGRGRSNVEEHGIPIADRIRHCLGELLFCINALIQAAFQRWFQNVLYKVNAAMNLANDFSVF